MEFWVGWGGGWLGWVGLGWLGCVGGVVCREGVAMLKRGIYKYGSWTRVDEVEQEIDGRHVELVANFLVVRKSGTACLHSGQRIRCFALGIFTGMWIRCADGIRKRVQ